MAPLGWSILAAVVLAGHVAFWLGVANRLHGTGLGRWHVKAWTWFFRLVMFLLPVVGAGWVLAHGFPCAWETAGGAPQAGGWCYVALAYAALCLAIDVIYFPLWLRDRLWPRPACRSRGVQRLEIGERLGYPPIAGRRTELLSRIPGNQLLTLDVVELELEIPRLPPQLDGLSLVHLTDLHFSGRITPSYFHEALRIVGDWQPDLLLVTGDLCERARFIPWIDEILAPMEARLGKFFVLGNHDLRTCNVPRLRAALASAGYCDLSGVWRNLAVGDARIVLGGDERPWLGTPLDPGTAPARSPEEPELRLVLLHTPDRVAVARAADADLVLAGHTHGGQIRFPPIGAVVCPSWYGMRYDAGLFATGSTRMYVGRGLACLTPLRFFCPNELTRLVLRSPQVGAAPRAAAR